MSIAESCVGPGERAARTIALDSRTGNTSIKVMTSETGGHLLYESFRRVPTGVRTPLLYLLVFAWLWFWRTNRFTGGDSEQWERMIHGGAWFQETQAGVFFLVQLVRHMIDFAFGGTARMAFGIVSCLSGVAASAIVLKMFEGTPSRGTRMALVFTAGFTTLFYGHIESYAVPAAALLFHLLCIQRSTQDRWPVWTIPVSHALMVSMHLVALFVYPAVICVTAFEARRRSLGSRRIPGILACLGLSLLIWMIIRAMGDNRSGDSITYLLYVVRTLFSNPAELIDKLEPRLKLLFAFWNGAAVAILLPQAWPRRSDILVRYWSPYLALLFVFTVVWGAARGEPDFDLHSFPWIMATVLAAWVYRPVAWARAAVAFILAINVGLWMARPASYAEILHRGTATVRVCQDALEQSRQILLDDRLGLDAVNRFVPVGPHRVSVFESDRVLRTTFNLERGKSYRLCVDGDGTIKVTPTADGSRRDESSRARNT